MTTELTSANTKYAKPKLQNRHFGTGYFGELCTLKYVLATLSSAFT